MCKRKPVRHNPVARVLASPLFHKRTVKSRKGRGSYSRKGRASRATS